MNYKFQPTIWSVSVDEAVGVDYCLVSASSVKVKINKM